MGKEIWPAIQTALPAANLALEDQIVRRSHRSKEGTTPLFLALLTAVFAYSVWMFGGTRSEHWNVCLGALGMLGLGFWLRARKVESAPPLPRGLRVFLMLLPMYVLLQLAPMPAVLLRVVSPERSRILSALIQAVPGAAFAPLSVVPAETFAQFLRVCAYIVVIVLVRDLAWRCHSGPWKLVVPLIAIALIEAAIGLLQFAADPGSNAHSHGTYINKNHFAGLLEMTLPLAVMYAIALLRRGGPVTSARTAIKACVALSAAAVIFIAVFYSFSRMGFMAALFSLFVMGAIAISAGIPAWKKGLLALAFAALFLISFIFLPSDELVLQYAKLAPVSKATGEGRLTLWGETLRLIAAYPLFGCGLGGYESAFNQYQASFLLKRVDYAHNDFLQVVAELGVLGFLIAAGLAVVVVLPTLRAAAAPSGIDRRYLALGCIGAFVVIFIHSLVDFNLYIPANGFLLAWMCGIAASLPFLSRQHRRTRAYGSLQAAGGSGSSSPVTSMGR